MPVAEFAGARNWGYDGVCLFAPSRTYGRPDDLRALRRRRARARPRRPPRRRLQPPRARRRVPAAVPPAYITDRAQHAVGRRASISTARARTRVRRFIVDNARPLGARVPARRPSARRDARADRRRADAISSRSSRPTVRAARAGRPVAIYRRGPSQPRADRRSRGARRLGPRRRLGRRLPSRRARRLAGDAHGYYRGLRGIARRAGAHAARRAGCSRASTPRTAARRVAPTRRACRCTGSWSACRTTIRSATGRPAIGCTTRSTPAAWRAASTLLLTAPMTPLLFMGQEWAASSPFQYFTDLEPALGSPGHRRTAARVRGFPGVRRPGGARAHPGSAGRGDVRAQHARLGRARTAGARASRWRSTPTCCGCGTRTARSARRSETSMRGGSPRRRHHRDAPRGGR